MESAILPMFYQYIYGKIMSAIMMTDDNLDFFMLDLQYNFKLCHR